MAKMIAEDQLRANAFDVLVAANEGIYHSGSAFEAEYHKGRIAGVVRLLEKLSIPAPVIDELKAEAALDYGCYE
jgi:hypothetical protein